MDFISKSDFSAVGGAPKQDQPADKKSSAAPANDLFDIFGGSPGSAPTSQPSQPAVATNLDDIFGNAPLLPST